MKLEIETNYVPLTYIIKQDVPEGISITIPPFIERRCIDRRAVIKIIIEFTTSISASVVSAWLYDKLKNSPTTKMIYNRKEITIEPSNIIKVIEENAEITKRE